MRAAEKRRYPRNWQQISAEIKFVRAGGRCECEGECRGGHDGRCEARHGQPHQVTGSKVILTTAHLDREPRNCDPTNLRAMCQRCYVRYDVDQHRANAAWTRAGRPDVQLELDLDGAA